MKPENVTPEEVVSDCSRCHTLIRATTYKKWPPGVRWDWEVRGICPLCALVEDSENLGLYDDNPEEDCG